jgi:predicted ester cyclase
LFVGSVEPFAFEEDQVKVLEVMRRYAYGFVNSHDFDVCRELMSDDYVLHMGDDDVIGRDNAYIPAVRHQIDQFPTLGFAIHDLLTDGSHAALLFSEHGTSVRDGVSTASWMGVSIYRFADGRLRECWVEQDHFSRRAQLRSGVGEPVAPIAVDPWSATSVPDASTAAAVRDWVAALSFWPPPGAVLDPGPHGEQQPRLEVSDVRTDVLVVSGNRAAFHLTVCGRYVGGMHGDVPEGLSMNVHCGAFAEVGDAGAVAVRGITNRVAVQRALRGAQDV